MRQTICLPFDRDREFYTPKPEWVRSRHAIFHDFTLPSLFNQTRHDFTIALLCGQRHRALTESLSWHPRVRLIHDDGRALLNEIVVAGDDFAGFTRLDSDDLIARDGIAWIDGLCEKMKDPAKVAAFVCNRNLYWDRMYCCIGRHHRLCNPPPFVTRIYPRSVMANYDAWRAKMFLGHGRATTAALHPVAMGENVYCIVKHGTNTSYVRRGQNHQIRTAELESELLKEKTIISLDPAEIARLLEPYGISAEMSRRPPGVEFRGGEFIDHTQGGVI